MFGAHLKDEYEEGGGGEGQEGGKGCAHLGGAGLKWQWILPATYSAPSPSPPLFSQTVSLLQDILKRIADFDQGGAALQPIGQNPLKLFLITSFLSVFEMGCVSCKDPATDN